MTSATDTVSPTTDPARLLRTALRVDAVGSGVLGLLLGIDSGPLGQALGLPTAMAVATGIVMLLAASAMGLISYRTNSPGLVWAVITVDAVMIVAMLLAAVTDVLPLTGPGTTFLITGVAITAIFADVKVVGLRRITRAAR